MAAVEHTHTQPSTSSSVSSVSLSPTDAELRETIQELIPTVDVQELRVRQFLQLLSERMGNVNLTPRKSFIKLTVADTINGSEDDEEEEESEEEEEADDDSSVEVPVKKKKGSGGRGGGGGLAAKKEISDALADFLGQGKEMARTDIVKSLWEYIREHELQNPSNKQEILLDKKMRKVFGCKMFTMFTMNKYVSAHVHPFKPVDLTASSTPSKKRKASSSSKGSDGAKKKRKAGTQPPHRLSPELAAVTGEPILPRPQVVKKVWEYIRSNNLQNPSDKREILCDEALQKVMGGKKKVTMFNMNTFFSPHLIEKVDRSEYQAEDDDDSD